MLLTRSCHVNAMFLPRPLHVLAMLLPLSCHVLAMLLPLYCHVLATLLPRSYHALVTLLPRSCHVHAGQEQRIRLQRFGARGQQQLLSIGKKKTRASTPRRQNVLIDTVDKPCKH